MRKFSIENSLGESIDLSTNKLWLQNPGGLGMAKKRSYSSIDDGFFEITSDDEAQQPLTGDIIFLEDEVYASFSDITNWLCRSTGLVFVYCPYGTTKYCRNVEFDSLGKTEKVLRRYLSCPVVFTPKTPWYTRERYSFTFSHPATTNYKRYSYRYDSQYAASVIPGSHDFEIDGHYPGEVELRAEGPIASPVLELTNTATKEVYGRIDMSAITIKTGESLLYSTKVTDTGIWKIEGKTRIDLIDQIELLPNTESFFKIPTNTPLTATITVDGIFDAKATMDIFRYYRLR